MERLSFSTRSFRCDLAFAPRHQNAPTCDPPYGMSEVARPHQHSAKSPSPDPHQHSSDPSPFSERYLSASSAAIAPEPAEVIAWRYTESATSPAAKTPSGGPCLDASLVANLRRRGARCHCEERARFARSHALLVARGHKVAFGRGLKLSEDACVGRVADRDERRRDVERLALVGMDVLRARASSLGRAARPDRADVNARAPRTCSTTPSRVG